MCGHTCLACSGQSICCECTPSGYCTYNIDSLDALVSVDYCTLCSTIDIDSLEPVARQSAERTTCCAPSHSSSLKLPRLVHYSPWRGLTSCAVHRGQAHLVHSSPWYGLQMEHTLQLTEVVITKIVLANIHVGCVYVCILYIRIQGTKILQYTSTPPTELIVAS